MADYQATFTAGARRRVITFAVSGAKTRQELERAAWSRLPFATSLPKDHWTLETLARVVYEHPAEEGRS